MTSEAEIRALIERLRTVNDTCAPYANEVVLGWCHEAASALSAMLEERDKAREYGGQARIRENKAEDARISAQSRITDLEQKLAKAREALEPFAIAAKNFDRMPIKDPDNWFAYAGEQSANEVKGEITVSSLRRARSTLEALK